MTPFASFLLPANRALGGEVYARLEGWLRDGTLVVSVPLAWAVFRGLADAVGYIAEQGGSASGRTDGCCRGFGKDEEPDCQRGEARSASWRDALTVHKIKIACFLY